MRNEKQGTGIACEDKKSKSQKTKKQKHKQQNHKKPKSPTYESTTGRSQYYTYRSYNLG